MTGINAASARGDDILFEGNQKQACLNLLQDEISDSIARGTWSAENGALKAYLNTCVDASEVMKKAKRILDGKDLSYSHITSLGNSINLQPLGLYTPWDHPTRWPVAPNFVHVVSLGVDETREELWNRLKFLQVPMLSDMLKERGVPHSANKEWPKEELARLLANTVASSQPLCVLSTRTLRQR